MKIKLHCLALVLIFLGTSGLKACVIDMRKDKKTEEVQSQESPPSPVVTQISGSVTYDSFQGGSLSVEARLASPCSNGFCLVQGAKPLAKINLTSPSAFQLFFQTQFKDVIILVEHTDKNNKIRIGHKYINAFASQIDPVEISLDKPYPALY